jgi:putative membrane protein
MDLRRIEMKRLYVLAPVMALLAGSAQAQQTAVTGDAATGPLNDVDRQFVAAAASGGLAEVNAARLAEQQASKTQVKNFARQMITDHGKANQELASVASQEGVTAPTEPDARQKAAATKLKTLGGPAFDRAYLRGEIQSHKDTIALFQNEAKSGQDPKLKQFASQTLPTLKHHLQMAQKIGTK